MYVCYLSLLSFINFAQEDDIINSLSESNDNIYVSGYVICTHMTKLQQCSYKTEIKIYTTSI